MKLVDKQNQKISSEKLAQIVVEGMLEKKAQDIALIDLRKIQNTVTDFFVICSGTSDTHVDAITDEVTKELGDKTDQTPLHSEGKQHKAWVLIDYFDVVVHIFKKDYREFYDLENLWGDAHITHINNLT